jgi:hypothetical protein
LDVTLLQSIDIDRRSSPILYNIAEAYDLFVCCYGRNGCNLLVTPIFLNPAVRRSRFDKKLLDIEFFGKKFYNRYRDEVRKLTINDCYNGNSLKSLDEFREMNLPFNVATWMSLRAAIILAKKNIPPMENPPPTLIRRFLNTNNKGYESVP